MAAERDAAGPSGPGLSGTGRDHAGLEAGTTRSMSMGDAPGSADVHAGIAFNPQGESDTGLRERTTTRVKDMAGSVGETAGNVGDRVRSVAGDVAGRAGEFASSARDRVSTLADRAQGALEERGWLDRLRENPLPVLGVAFAAGFLLAGGSTSSVTGGGQRLAGGSTGGTGGGSRAQRVRGELRSALVAGLSAGLSQGARAFLRNVGAEDGIVNDLLQNLPGLGGEAGGLSSTGRSQGGRSSGRSGGSSSYGTPSGGGRTGGMRSQGATSGTGRSPRGGTHREPSHREQY